jgi:hypothetical protein
MSATPLVGRVLDQPGEPLPVELLDALRTDDQAARVAQTRCGGASQRPARSGAAQHIHMKSAFPGLGVRSPWGEN